MIPNTSRLPAFATGLLLAFMLAIPSTASAQRFKPGDSTIAEIAVSNGNFNTLVTALICTGLVGAVADPETELTVFAPTDEAFADIGLDSTNVCVAFDVDSLTNILLYHVAGERRPSPSVINGKNKEIVMLNGGSIFPVGQRSLTIVDNGDNPVDIVIPDVLASNGIIHVINSVLLP